MKIALGEFPPLLLAGLRFTLVALLLAPFCGLPRRLGAIALLAVTLGLMHFPMIFYGLSRLDASTAAIVLQLQVPFGVIMAAFAFGERLTWREIGGMAIAFLGVALIGGAPRLEANRLGVAMLVVAAFAWGLGTIQLKRLGGVGPFALNGWLGLFMAVELLSLSRLFEGDPLPFVTAASWRGWAAIGYIAVLSTIAAFGIWSRIVSRYTVGQTLPYMLTVPLFAILGGIVLNGDRMTPDIVAGGLMTVLGVGLIVLKRSGRASPAAAEAA